MWLGVDLWMDTKKEMYLKDIGLWAQTMLVILGSVINMSGEIYMII